MFGLLFEGKTKKDAVYFMVNQLIVQLGSHFFFVTLCIYCLVFGQQCSVTVTLQQNNEMSSLQVRKLTDSGSSSFLDRPISIAKSKEITHL